MTRGFGGRIHPRHVRSIHNSSQSDDRGSQLRMPQHNSQSSGQQQSSFRPPTQGAEAAGASEEGTGISPENFIAYYVVKTRATLQEHARSPFRSKRRLPKLRRGRISRSRFYILLHAILPTYTSAALASHSQASWAQLPLPPPLQPTHTQSQQPEGHTRAQQQRDFREESEARIVNSTVPESKHIY
jgi:hypothetical protein